MWSLDAACHAAVEEEDGRDKIGGVKAGKGKGGYVVEDHRRAKIDEDEQTRNDTAYGDGIERDAEAGTDSSKNTREW